MPEEEDRALDPEEILRRLQEAMGGKGPADLEGDEGADPEGDEDADLEDYDDLDEDAIDPEVMSLLTSIDASADELMAALGEAADDDEEDEEEVERAISGLLGMADGLSGLMERLGISMPDVEAMLEADMADPYGDPDWAFTAHVAFAGGRDAVIAAEFDLLRAIESGSLREAEEDDETRESMEELTEQVIGGELGKMLSDMRPGESAARIMQVLVRQDPSSSDLRDITAATLPPEVNVPLSVRGGVLYVDLHPAAAALDMGPVREGPPIAVSLDAFDDGADFAVEGVLGPEGTDAPRVRVEFFLADEPWPPED